jgi:ubiquinone/menaquinone biosynthesis C-methylase UbiE
MLPSTGNEEYEHRKRKRQLEIAIVIENIATFLKSWSDLTNGRINILEFGSGDGFQIPYLRRIGNVIASDICTSDGVKNLQEVKFVECSINHAPFGNGQFDVIFSSHVIQYLNELLNAFREMQRIGKSSCIYAFSVPTNIWLLLSIPAQYYNRIAKGLRRTEETDSKLTKFLRRILPEGHGINPNFIDCYRNFKIKNWQRLFTENGFSVIEVKPLLLYGPSEWPIIPTSTCKTNLCSSVLFLMMKRQNPLEPA